MKTDDSKENKSIEVKDIPENQLDDNFLMLDRMAAIGYLSTGMLHDLRNTTGSIKANMSILSEYWHDINKFFSKVKPLLSSIGDDHINAIIKEMDLDYILEEGSDALKETTDTIKLFESQVVTMHMYAGGKKDHVSFSKVKLEELFDKTFAIVRYIYVNKIELKKEYSNTGEVFCNETGIIQVLVNLLTNAAKAIKKTGRSDGVVVLKTYLKDNFAVAEVEDNGCGMTAEVKKRIFQPFFTTAKGSEGTGLGMAVSAQIVKKHEGKILVESRVGKGSIFRILIPVGKDKK